MVKDILELCERVMDDMGSALDGFHCDGITCRECPFSSYNNNEILCGNDSEENYRYIAEEYIKEHQDYIDDDEEDDEDYEEEDEDDYDTKYQDGDKVKIREDLVVGKWYADNIAFVTDMKKYMGKIMTIEKAFKDCGVDNYFLKEDNEGFYWTNDMFEKVDEINNVSSKDNDTKYHIGDILRVKEDLEVDETYNDVFFVDEMEDFRGEIVTIEEAHKNTVLDEDRYQIEGSDCYWSNDMFEAVEVNDTKYHKGDKLKVRKDLQTGRTYEDVYVTEEMGEFINQIVTIKKAFKSYGDDRYIIENDEYEFRWSNAMFEEDIEADDTKYHIGDVLRIKQDLVVDERYGDMTFVGGMKKFQNEPVKIRRAYINPYTKHDNYYIEGSDFCWTNDMFERFTMVDSFDEETLNGTIVSEKRTEPITLDDNTKLLDNTLEFIEENNVGFIEGNIIYGVIKGDIEYLESAKKFLDILIMRKK